MATFTLDPKALPTPTADQRQALDALTDAEITAAAESDPDNGPLTKGEVTALRVARRLKHIRSRQNLSQRAFSAGYKIPVGNIRDWEQGRSIPDKTVLAYLSVIQSAPDVVQRALDD